MNTKLWTLIQVSIIMITIPVLPIVPERNRLDAKKYTEKKLRKRPIKRIGYYPISPATKAAVESMRPHIQKKLQKSGGAALAPHYQTRPK